ncbi:MAG TPA: iron ABC transporter substrate-binding protein, partial [Novosphingobium sp.]|nr:iron ABC transporter substrate-binding protein [Novosphingobium sp.]
GFANAVAARGLGQGAVLPLEAMLADPPRLILTAGGAAEDRVLAHPALGALHGTARDELDLRLLYCGGPTIPRTAARLAEIRETMAP